MELSSPLVKGLCVILTWRFAGGECDKQQIQACLDPLFAYWTKDAFPDLLSFAQSFTDRQTRTWCLQISGAEVCLTKLSNCSQDNTVAMEAVLDVANFVCQTKSQDEVEVHRACAFRDWNSRSGSCRNELLHQMSDTRTTAKCRAVKNYIECIRTDVAEECSPGDVEWIGATLSHYALPQAEHRYDCNIQSGEKRRRSVTTVLLVVFIPLIVTVTLTVIFVAIRHKRNRTQIKKSLTAVSLVSRDSSRRESKLNQTTSGEAHVRPKPTASTYVSLETNTKDDESSNKSDEVSAEDDLPASGDKSATLAQMEPVSLA